MKPGFCVGVFACVGGCFSCSVFFHPLLKQENSAEFAKLKSPKREQFYKGKTKLILQEEDLTTFKEVLQEIGMWKKEADDWRDACKDKEVEAAVFTINC